MSYGYMLTSSGPAYLGWREEFTETGAALLSFASKRRVAIDLVGLDSIGIILIMIVSKDLLQFTKVGEI